MSAIPKASGKSWLSALNACSILMERGEIVITSPTPREGWDLGRRIVEHMAIAGVEVQQSIDPQGVRLTLRSSEGGGP